MKEGGATERDMGRIEEGFRRRFRELLARVRPRRLDFGVELLMGRARARAESEGLSAVDAFTRQYEETRTRVVRRLQLMAACQVSPPEPPPAAPLQFLCDGSLGGLARWIRAAGYRAEVAPGARDALVREAIRTGAVLLSTDVHLWDRRLVRDGTVRALWLPSGLEVTRQLGMVLRDLELTPREPRCMACGGALEPAPKADVAERIPPRTARWKDDYFVCARCGRLFWEGTHWERIRDRLRSC
jgi:uncharacterized protein with PIN domain